jgi:uncharacterized Zn finger protein (UPF0148 family)
MLTIHCPGCGRATFAVGGRPTVDRCPRCESHLAEGEHLCRVDPRAVELRIRERLYDRPKGRARGRAPDR